MSLELLRSESSARWPKYQVVADELEETPLDFSELVVLITGDQILGTLASLHRNSSLHGLNQVVTTSTVVRGSICGYITNVLIIIAYEKLRQKDLHCLCERSAQMYSTGRGPKKPDVIGERNQ